MQFLKKVTDTIVFLHVMYKLVDVFIILKMYYINTLLK